MNQRLADIDDLKHAWKQLDQRLARQQALAFEQFKEGRVRAIQSGLRPLYWGQVAQVLVGAACVAVSAATCVGHRGTAHLAVAGAIGWLYGLALVMHAGRTLALIARLDPTAPVVAVQQRLADLRRWYVVGELALGLPWWFLWLPAFMVLTAMLGVDVYARAPLLLVYCLAVGVAGLALTGALHWLAARPGWPRLARAVNESLVANSLHRAQAALDEVQRFAGDGDATA